VKSLEINFETHFEMTEKKKLEKKLPSFANLFHYSSTDSQKSHDDSPVNEAQKEIMDHFGRELYQQSMSPNPKSFFLFNDGALLRI